MAARFISGGVLASLALTAGCLAPSTASHEALEIPARGPDGNPVAMVHVHDRLGWPFTLDAVSVGVDGDAVAELSAEALDDHDVVGAVALPKGEHRVTATALARKRGVKAWPVRRAIDVGRQIASALRHCHDGFSYPAAATFPSRVSQIRRD